MAQTIYALASGRGRAGVAIIRVSGPQALHSLETLSGLRDPARRHAHFVRLCHPVSRETIDQALVLFLKARIVLPERMSPNITCMARTPLSRNC